MKLELVNATVVVIAQEHNPSILHPSFLTSQKIVPADWEPADPPICTPPFSIVKFRNGIVFLVEGTKLQITDNNPGPNPGNSLLPGLASTYIKTLPHVPYKAIGVNFMAFAECATAESLILEKFLTRGAWNDDARKPSALGLRFVYPVSDGLFRLAVDPGTVQQPGTVPARKGLLLKGNYHTDLPADGPVEHAGRLLGLFPSRCGDFIATTSRIFGLEH